MPMDHKRYPENWDEIARAIKDAVDWTCQDCGRPCRRPGESLEDLADRLDAKWLSEIGDPDEGLFTLGIDKPKQFCLTVAHLNHIPEDCTPGNLRALCSVCHCRMDLKAMRLKKRLKLEYQGQLTLNL